MKKIKLTGIHTNKNSYAIVDDDLVLPSGKWSLTWNGYAIKRIGGRKGKTYTMHGFIMNVPKGKTVDHINGDKLDNRKENLRICSQSENLMNRGKQKNNSSGYKGVRYRKDVNRFIVEIGYGGKGHYLGCFKSAKEAYKVYIKACKEYHKQYATFDK